MDEENIKSWAAQPDVCRCCLSSSGTLDLTASYITDAGIKEVFSDMLQECFGLTLSYLTDWGPSRLVCTLCVGHLRDACSFRKQVLRAESLFDDYYTNRELITVKLETEQELHCTDFNDDVGMDTDADENKDALKQSLVPIKDTVQKAIPEPEHRKRKKRKSLKPKKKKIKADTDYDSDIPIAELSKKKEPFLDSLKHEIDNNENIEQPNCKLKKNELNVCEYKDENLSKGPQHTVPKIGAKQISERKRVILTCAVVLRDTTACPFRHHKSWFQCFFCNHEFMEISLLRHHTIENHNIDDELKQMKRYPRSL